MADFQCRLSAQGFSMETFLLSNATRPQSRRRGKIYPIKLLFGTFSPWGQATRDTRTQFCSKGPGSGYELSQATKSPNEWLDTIAFVDRSASHRSYCGQKQAFSSFREAEQSLYAALHVEKYVSIAKQIAQWRRDFTTLRGREPMYEDMPEKIRKLESSRVRLGERYVPSRISSAFHFKRSALDRSSAFQDFC